MADFETQAEFETGDVRGASIDLRPDAVVSLVAHAPGPSAIGNITLGVSYQGWYVRPSESGFDVLIANVKDADWSDEAILFTVAGASIEMLALAFDETGRPIVAMQRDDGHLWIRYWNGASYTLTDLGIGESPAIVHRAPDNPFSEIVLFHERAGDLYYRYGSEDYAEEHDVGVSLNSDQKLWRLILGQENRIHLILSTWNTAQHTYSLQRISETEPYPAACLDAEGYTERIDDGVLTLLVFRDDGSITTLDCSAEFNALLIGAGGNSGGSGQATPTILWCTLAGLGLDPNFDTAPPEHEADGGGDGATDDQDGGSGASGGGGGGESPSQHMWTAGGLGLAGQGYNAGGGRSTWGILPRKSAASGGGGGYGGPGKGSLGTAKGGKGGPGARIPGWNWSGPKGGTGWSRTLEGATGPIQGGGGGGGVILIDDLVIPPNQTVPVEVGQAAGGGAAGQGGKRGSAGITGMLVVGIRRLNLDTFDWAVVSGGVESIIRGFTYYKFLSTDTVVVVTPGRVEAFVMAGGAGGGSGVGGGGGGADIRVIETLLLDDTLAIIGAGGAGGTAGGVGDNGEDSSFGDHAIAQGGGGGAGSAGSAGSRASGGGGNGDGGAPGPGKAMRAYPGGEGGGFPLTAGGDSLAAGGGGGAGSEGDRGATQETQGDELVDHWEVPSAGYVNIGEQRFDMTIAGAGQATLIGSEVAVEAMMVQGRVMRSHSSLAAGVMARARHPTGDPDEAATGYFAAVSNQVFLTSAGNVTFFNTISFWTHIQIYAKDDLQEYALLGSPGPGEEVPLEVRRKTGTDAGENGNIRSFGFTIFGTLPTGGNKSGYCDDIMCFASKYLEVGNVPSGGSVEVYEGDQLVSSASESSGTALVDLSIYGDGSSGAFEPVPLGGWAKCVIKNASEVIVAEAAGSFYPGGEFDVVGSTLEVRIDTTTGPENFPITGLLQFSTFDELTPGPENGDGGDGREFSLWILATGEGVGGYFAGGGAGGAEIFLGGVGGSGGGGDGAFSVNTPDDGVVNTGSGGGGSGDSSVDGGDGGSGLVIVRTEIPMPPGAEIPTSGLVVHHDAKLITGFEDGEVLTAWEDLTAEGNDLASNGSPLYRDGFHGDSLEGWPAVRTGVDDFMEYASAFFSGETAGEIFVVMKSDSDGGGVTNGMWQFNSATAGCAHPWSNGIIYETWGRTAQIAVGDPADLLDEAHIYHVKAVPGEYTVRVNTTQLYTASYSPSFPAFTPAIGKTTSPAFWFRGLWGHLLIYDRELTPAERTSIEDYLTWYWSLAY